MPSRAELVQYARRFKGVPFHHIGRSEFGIDCIGLLVLPLHHFGITDYDIKCYPRDPDGKELCKVLDSSDFLDQVPIEGREEGDVGVFWINHHTLPRHFGWLTDKGLLHTHTRRGGGVVVEHGLDDWWLKRLCRVYRVRGIE